MKKIAVVMFLIMSGVLFADTCSISCTGNSCSVTATDVECICHPISGDTCCNGRSTISMVKTSADEKSQSKVKIDEELSPEDWFIGLSFAQRGGQLGKLLEHDLFEFYNLLIVELGFDERVQGFIQSLQKLKKLSDQKDSSDYRFTLERMEHGVLEFSIYERNILSELAMSYQ